MEPRRICALLIASDCFLSTRWIPSELNVADGPSRRWEHLRTGNAAGRASEEKRLQSINKKAYPPRSINARTANPAFSRQDLAEEEETDPSETSSPEEPRGQGQSESPEGEDTYGSSTLRRSDRPGKAGGDSFCGHGLCTQDARPESLCQTEATQHEVSGEIRRGMLLVSQQHLHSRRRVPRRKQVLGSSGRLKPRLWPEGHASSYSNTTSGVVQSGSTPDQATNPMEHGGSHRDEDDIPGPAAAGLGCLVDVHCIPQTRRGFASSQKRRGKTHSRAAPSCDSTASFGKTRNLQGGTVRRDNSAGLSSAAVVGQCAQQGASDRNLSLPDALHRNGQSLEEGTARPGAGFSSQRVVPAAALRTQSRSFPSTADHAGDQTSRPLVLRHTAGGRLNQEFFNLPLKIQGEVLKLERQFAREGQRLFTPR